MKHPTRKNAHQNSPKTDRTSFTPFETLESRRLFSVAAASPVLPILSQAPLATTAAVVSTSGTGISGKYSIGNNFQTPALVRLDSKINFRWSNGRPDQDIPRGVFSALWTGQIQPATTSSYTFYTDADSGTRVTINGVTVIDNFASRVPAVASGSIQLTGGQQYSILVEYVSRGTGAARMKLQWSSAAFTKTVVPTSVLYPTTQALPSNTQLLGSYYLGNNFNKLLMTRADPSVRFDWGTGVPDAAIPQHKPFTVRWTGEIIAPATGTYTFQTITDDGVRLWVNGVEIIKDWNVHSAQSDLGKIHLQAGQKYSIRMDYFQDGVGHTSAKLLWALPGQGRNLKYVHFITPGPATPANLSVTTISSTQLNVAWNDVQDETGFVLERAAVGSTNFVPIATLGTGVLTYADTGLNPATSYQYEIIATDAQGGSDPSLPVTGLTDPGAVTATATASGTNATVTFTTAGTPSGFVVERSPNGTTGWTSVGTPTSSPFTDTGLATDTTYFYRVTATDASGASAPSNVVSVLTAPAAPINLTATPTSASQVNLNWNNVPGETGFIIQQSADGVTGWTQIATVPAGITTFKASGLSAATKYYFRVLATNAGGSSAPSNVANATTSPANPAFSTLTTIFGLTGNGLVYSIDTSNGATTQIGTLSFGTNAAARDTLTGNFFYVSTGSSTVNLSAWNPNDQTNTVINPAIPLSGPVAEAAFRADGDMFLATDLGDLYEINSVNGTATHNGTIHANGTTLMTGNGDMAFGPDGTLYIETSSQLYSITKAAVDAATATTSVVTATDIGPTGTQNLQIAFGQNGILFGTDAAGQLYSVNTATAATTPVGAPSGINIGDLASVPLYADLKITQTASSFVRSSNGTYTLTVNNAGPDTTVGPMTLVDTLPAGVTYVSGAGTGWTFAFSGQTVTMTYSQNVASGATAPAVTLNVTVAPLGGKQRDQQRGRQYEHLHDQHRRQYQLTGNAGHWLITIPLDELKAGAAAKLLRLFSVPNVEVTRASRP